MARERRTAKSDEDYRKNVNQVTNKEPRTDFLTHQQCEEAERAAATKPDLETKSNVPDGDTSSEEEYNVSSSEDLALSSDEEDGDDEENTAFSKENTVNNSLIEANSPNSATNQRRNLDTNQRPNSGPNAAPTQAPTQSPPT